MIVTSTDFKDRYPFVWETNISGIPFSIHLTAEPAEEQTEDWQRRLEFYEKFRYTRDVEIPDDEIAPDGCATKLLTENGYTDLSPMIIGYSFEQLSQHISVSRGLSQCNYLMNFGGNFYHKCQAGLDDKETTLTFSGNGMKVTKLGTFSIFDAGEKSVLTVDWTGFPDANIFAQIAATMHADRNTNGESNAIEAIGAFCGCVNFIDVI